MDKYKGKIEILIFYNNFEHTIGYIRQKMNDDAKGEYISHIDDDDIVPHDFCKTIMPLLDGVDYIGFNVELRNNDKLLKPVFHSLKYNEWKEDETGFYRGVTHLNPLKTEIARKATYLSLKNGEDYNWTVGVHKYMDAERNKGRKFTEHYINRNMYIYDHWGHAPMTDRDRMREVIKPRYNSKNVRFHSESTKDESVKIGIFCPTYHRPHKLQKVATNIEKTTKHKFTLYFGVEKEDTASAKAAKKTGHKVVVNKYSTDAGYANTIQSIYESSGESLFIHINDDFVFDKDWDVPLVNMFEDDNVMVVGVRQHESDDYGSAISMIRRSYIEDQSGVIDIPDRVFYPYPHHYTDTELTCTAKARGVWKFCDKLTIHHLNPGFTGAVKDETYRKNDATSAKAEAMFNTRKHLWENYNKEKDMARRKMTDEERKALSEKVKARWAERKKELSTEKSEPKFEAPKLAEKLDYDVLNDCIRVRDIMQRIRNENQNMIEAKQAVDALDEALARMGQVQGLLKQ